MLKKVSKKLKVTDAEQEFNAITKDAHWVYAKTLEPIGKHLQELKSSEVKYNSMVENNNKVMDDFSESKTPMEIAIKLLLIKVTELHEEYLKIQMKKIAVVEALEHWEKKAAEIYRESVKQGLRVSPPPQLKRKRFELSTKNSTEYMTELSSDMRDHMCAIESLSNTINKVQDGITVPILNIRR